MRQVKAPCSLILHAQRVTQPVLQRGTGRHGKEGTAGCTQSAGYRQPSCSSWGVRPIANCWWGQSLHSHRTWGHLPLDSWSPASVNLAHRHDSRYRWQIELMRLFSFPPKPMTTLVKEFLKGHKDCENRRGNTATELGAREQTMRGN